MRTGGVTPEAFPDRGRYRAVPPRLHRPRGVPFKATAGLHHPLRAEYRLTYAADSPRGTMFGFLNVFLAAAFLRRGLGRRRPTRLLEERSADAFEFSAGWDRVARDTALNRAGDRGGADEGDRGFGSCSFTEPVGRAPRAGLA